MKKSVLLIAFLVLIPISFSQEIYNAKSLIIDLSLTSEFEIIPRSSDYQIDYVTANLSFFPRDGINQDVLSLSTTPDAKEIGEDMIFRWDNPPIGELGFNVNSEIMTNDQGVKVRSKLKFPVEEMPAGVLPYIEPSATIDSDDAEIIKLASELASGEDDLYVVVHNIGVWTKNNINYELSTLTAGVSQKASWVLNARQGVCDEITNLFIAMLRSLGIPARFVSGVSYTELIEEGWGNHGWAEVYFPGYGWVPFDVTYGELGYIDPTHITLNKAIDAEEPSTKYQWYGRDINLVTKSLETEIKVKQIIGRTEQQISLNAIAVKDEVGFGSYNLIEATIKNLDNSYYSTELHVSKPLEVQLECCETKHVLLKPNERKKVYWTISIPDNLRKTSVYTFPIAVWSSKNFTSYTSFRSSLLNKVYSSEEVENMLAQREVEELKVYSKTVELSCKINKDEFYFSDKAFVVCSIRNTGNVMLEDVEFCGDDDCEVFDLGISQLSSKDFVISPSSIGAFEFVVKVESPDISKTGYIKYTVLDRPVILIENLKYPGSVSYGDEFSIEFLLNKSSLSTPKDVFVELYQGNIPKGWRMEKLSGEQALKVNLDSRNLGLNENNFEIIVKYKDGDGNEYLETKSFKIRLTDVPASKVIFVALKSLIMKLEYMNIRTLVFISGIIAVIFVFMIRYMIKKR